jgi:hypothetical protein
MSNRERVPLQGDGGFELAPGQVPTDRPVLEQAGHEHSLGVLKEAWRIINYGAVYDRGCSPAWMAEMSKLDSAAAISTSLGSSWLPRRMSRRPHQQPKLLIALQPGHRSLAIEAEPTSSPVNQYTSEQQRLFHQSRADINATATRLDIASLTQ